MENLDPPPFQIKEGKMARFGFRYLGFILDFGVLGASLALLQRVILTTLTLSQELKNIYAIFFWYFPCGLEDFHPGGPSSPQEDLACSSVPEFSSDSGESREKRSGKLSARSERLKEAS